MSGCLAAVNAGKSIGAFDPKEPNRPWVEWFYQPQTDTLYLLLFDHAPVAASQPYEQIDLPEFGASCFKMAKGLTPLVVEATRNGSMPCDCPECSQADNPAGFRPQAKGPEDFIGFRR